MRKFEFSDTLEMRKIDLITFLYITPADQDYVSARWAFNSGMYYSCYCLAAQAIEKYLKAALLFQNKDTTSYGHNHLKLWVDAKQFDKTGLLPNIFSWPGINSNHELWFNEQNCEEFIKYISVFGSPDNRYGAYGTNIDGSIIFAIDTICHAVRRLIRAQNFCQQDLFEQNEQAAFAADKIIEIKDWMLGPNFLLERLFTKATLRIGEKTELRHIFKNMNFAFAPDYENQTGSFGGIHSIGSPLQNWLVRHKEMDSSDENSAIVDELRDWAEKRIYINKSLRSELGFSNAKK